MKLTKTESGIIAVSEEYVSAGNHGDIVYATIAGTPDTLKLKFSPEVADVLGVWDIDQLVIDYSAGYVIRNQENIDKAYIDGFTRHAELTNKKEFTEEDLYNLMKMLRDTESRNMYEVFTRNFIQSLREFEVETFEIIGDTLLITKLKN